MGSIARGVAGVLGICDRIAVSQTDEIKYIQTWLADRHEPVPQPDPHGLTMAGMDHPMLMPGMLSPERCPRSTRRAGPRSIASFSKT